MKNRLQYPNSTRRPKKQSLKQIKIKSQPFCWFSIFPAFICVFLCVCVSISSSEYYYYMSWNCLHWSIAVAAWKQYAKKRKVDFGPQHVYIFRLISSIYHGFFWLCVYARTSHRVYCCKWESWHQKKILCRESKVCAFIAPDGTIIDCYCLWEVCVHRLFSYIDCECLWISGALVFCCMNLTTISQSHSHTSFVKMKSVQLLVCYYDRWQFHTSTSLRVTVLCENSVEFTIVHTEWKRRAKDHHKTSLITKNL